MPKRRWSIPTLARWQSTGLFVLGIVIIIAVWLGATQPGRHIGFDFLAYADGARVVAAGGNPYHRLISLPFDVRAGNSGVQASGYVYPPLLAVVLAIPTRLGFSLSALGFLWSLVTLVAVIWMGYELNRTLRGSREWTGALLFTTACLGVSLAMYDLHLGQADLLLATLAVISCALWLRRNPWAALPLGIAIAIKPNLAILLLIWLWKGDWRAALRGAIVAFLFVALPFAVIGLDGLRDYLTFMTQWNGFGANADVVNQTPYGVLLRAFTVNAYTTPLLVASWLVNPLRLLITTGLVVWWLHVVPRHPATDLTSGMSECLVAFPLAVLLSPFAENVHFCIVIPALVGLSWLAFARQLWNQPAAWILWGTLAFCYIPGMESLIYPTNLLLLPGQQDPMLGPILALARTGTLLWVALLTFFAGTIVLRTPPQVRPAIATAAVP